MKHVLTYAGAAVVALASIIGAANARPGDRGENYDPLKRKHVPCYPQKQADGTWKKVCPKPVVR